MPYRFWGLKIFTPLTLRFQDFQRMKDEYNFDLIMERLKKAANASSDNSLAEMLGVSSSGYAGYKKRNSVPMDKICKLANSLNMSIDWIMTGHGSMYRESDQSSIPHLQKINDRLIEERHRLGLKKGDMALAGGVANSTYTNYEDGSRSPDANFLAGIAERGADVQYILTGTRGAPKSPVSEQQAQKIVELYEALSEVQQKEILQAVEEKKQLNELRAMYSAQPDKKTG
jgi:transcriptional regulator with XRE-family HTH domain